MSFLNNLVSEFTHSNQGQRQDYPPQQQQSYGQQGYSSQSYNNNGPPQIPPPWIAEWDNRDNCWMYVNRETGQRTFEHPQPEYGRGGGGYPQQQYGGGGGYGQEQRGEYYEQQAPKPDHSRRNMALAGVAGLAGGALLMHEGEEVST